jgi:hypothetical protein
MSKRIAITLLGVIIGASCLGLSERLLTGGATAVLSNAEARVGRPLTPVSVAGVARRTVRRCAVGVYDC